MSGDVPTTSYIPATRLVELYEWKTLSPVDVVKEAFTRIADVNGPVNAYCLVDEEAALAALEATMA